MQTITKTLFTEYISSPKITWFHGNDKIIHRILSYNKYVNTVRNF